MEKRIVYILFLLLSTAGCKVTFETISLDQNYMKSLHSGEKITSEQIVISGKPVLSYNNGDLLSNRNWWSLKGINVHKEDEIVVVDFNNIGPTYTPFGADLPLLDFAKEDVVIKITARAEGVNGDVPLLSMQFDDSEGLQANAKRPEARIGNTEEFHDYYFDCSDMWLQMYPDKKEVNAHIINKVLFFVNPGNTGFTGKIFIKEFQALPIDSLKENPEFKVPVGKEGGVVSHFDSKDISDWWTAGSYSLSWSPDSSLKVNCSQVGPEYGSFGVKLPETMNMKMAYKITLKARYEGESYPELRIDVKDYSGYISNGSPATNWLEPTENKEFVTYVYIYKKNIFQAYPVRRELDKERITELLFFVNPGKEAWSGTIYIDDIEVVYTGLGGRNSER
ncbi:MAG: hypothetical protein PF481_05485 [Bacteroidales bacterium]|jgi:hypothetical protein|nr:hypothetical protein [Bacteroidales bacterium]